MTRKLLIADDTEDILVLLRIILGSEFSIVAEAADGSEALEQWELHRHEDVFALILDYRMPSLTGLDVARRVLADDPDQRVLLFSANFDDDLRAEALAVGVTAVIDKDDLVGLATHPALAA